MTSQIGEWIPVETTETPGKVRADHGALHLAGMSWAYLTPVQWEALKEAGDRLVAGMLGRKAVELAEAAEAAGALEDFAWQVAGTFRNPVAAPALEAMTDADWAHVARVIREFEGTGVSVTGPLREFWDAAGKALADG
jgi:hypothetical protein